MFGTIPPASEFIVSRLSNLSPFKIIGKFNIPDSEVLSYDIKYFFVKPVPDEESPPEANFDMLSPPEA